MGALAALVFSAETTLRQVAVSHVAAASTVLEKDRRVITWIKASPNFSYIHGTLGFESRGRNLDRLRLTQLTWRNSQRKSAASARNRPSVLRAGRTGEQSRNARDFDCAGLSWI